MIQLKVIIWRWISPLMDEPQRDVSWKHNRVDLADVRLVWLSWSQCLLSFRNCHRGHYHLRLERTHTCKTDTSTTLKIVRFLLFHYFFCVYFGGLFMSALCSKPHHRCVCAWIMIKKQVGEEVNVKWEGFQRMSNSRLTWRNQRQQWFLPGWRCVWVSDSQLPSGTGVFVSVVCLRIPSKTRQKTNAAFTFQITVSL